MSGRAPMLTEHRRGTWSPFAVEYLDGGGVCRCPLAEAGRVAFESVRPVRSFPSFRGQRNWPGLWWSATVGAHVGFESWLERDHLMLLDFDRDVVAVAAQPFWLFFPDGDGVTRQHAPDFFARCRDGTGVVIDCRADDRISDGDAEAFAATAAACALVGWDYRRVGTPDAVVVENVRWLAGYRHPRFADAVLAGRLREVFAEGCPLVAGAASAGRLVSTLPVVFHELWQGELAADLTVPLTEASLVWRSRR
jgi:hypothetical protein